MIKNIFAFIGVIAVLVSILGMTTNPVKKTIQPSTNTVKKQIVRKQVHQKKEKHKELTETKITMTEEYKQLLKVE